MPGPVTPGPVTPTASTIHSEAVTTTPPGTSGVMQIPGGGNYTVTANSNVETGLANRSDVYPDTNSARQVSSSTASRSPAMRCLFGGPTAEDSQQLRDQVEQIQAEDRQRVFDKYGDVMAVELLPGHQIRHTGQTVPDFLFSETQTTSNTLDRTTEPANKASGVQSDSPSR